MQIGKRQVLDEAAALFKEFIGLAGKADHNISANRSIGHGFMDLSDLLGVMPWAVLAMHPPENAVAAGLQWHMRVPGDAPRSGDQRDQLIAPVHGFDRADADFFYARMLQQRADKLFKTLLWLEVAAPAAQVDAAEHDLAIAGGDQRVGFFDHALQLHRAALAANAGNDAERTTVVAAILDFQIGARFFSDRIAGENRSCDQLRVGKDIAHQSESRCGKRHGFQGDKILRRAFMHAMVAKALLARTTLTGFRQKGWPRSGCGGNFRHTMLVRVANHPGRSEEHTSELQS